MQGIRYCVTAPRSYAHVVSCSDDVCAFSILVMAAPLLSRLCCLSPHDHARPSKYVLCPCAYCYHRTDLYRPSLHTGGTRNSGSMVRRPMVLRRRKEWIPRGEPMFIPRAVCIRDPTGKSPGRSPCQGLPRPGDRSPVLWTVTPMGSVPKPGSHTQHPRKLRSIEVLGQTHSFRPPRTRGVSDREVTQDSS